MSSKPAALLRPQIVSAVAFARGITVQITHQNYEDDGSNAFARFGSSRSHRLLGYCVGSDDDLQRLRRQLAPFTRAQFIEDHSETRDIIAKFFAQAVRR